MTAVQNSTTKRDLLIRKIQRQAYLIDVECQSKDLGTSLNPSFMKVIPTKDSGCLTIYSEAISQFEELIQYISKDCEK